MRKLFVLVGMFVLLFALPLFGQSVSTAPAVESLYAIFPVGNFQGVNWEADLRLVNAGSRGYPGYIQSQGGLRVSEEFTPYVIMPGESYRQTLRGEGPLQFGFAEVYTGTYGEVTGVLNLNGHDRNGLLAVSLGVPLLTARKNFTFPISQEGGERTWAAILNPTESTLAVELRVVVRMDVPAGERGRTSGIMAVNILVLPGLRLGFLDEDIPALAGRTVESFSIVSIVPIVVNAYRVIGQTRSFIHSK